MSYYLVHLLKQIPNEFVLKKISVVNTEDGSQIMSSNPDTDVVDLARAKINISK